VKTAADGAAGDIQLRGASATKVALERDEGGCPLLENLREICGTDAAAEIPDPLKIGIAICINEELAEFEDAVELVGRLELARAPAMEADPKAPTTELVSHRGGEGMNQKLEALNAADDSRRTLPVGVVDLRAATVLAQGIRKHLDRRAVDQEVPHLIIRHSNVHNYLLFDDYMASRIKRKYFLLLNK
jgi:hypothetical protein